MAASNAGRTGSERASARAKAAPGGPSAAARATPRQGVGVAPRSAPDVEHEVAGTEAEGVDQKGGLLIGALGERVAQISRTDEVGQRLEPVMS